MYREATETERLLIRKFRPEDWTDLYAYLSLPSTYAFEPGEPTSEAQAMTLAQERAGAEDFLAVVLKDEGRMIGHLYFHRAEPVAFRTWELGYIFNPAYHNRGYCTEAAAKIIGYAFEALEAHRIVAFCNPRNEPSWRVLEKVGMRREGFFRKKAFFRRNAAGEPIWHDCYAYGMLEEDREEVGTRSGDGSDR